MNSSDQTIGSLIKISLSYISWSFFSYNLTLNFKCFYVSQNSYSIFTTQNFIVINMQLYLELRTNQNHNVLYNERNSSFFYVWLLSKILFSSKSVVIWQIGNRAIIFFFYSKLNWGMKMMCNKLSSQHANKFVYQFILFLLIYINIFLGNSLILFFDIYVP